MSSPGRVLVVNPGSSSLKLGVLDAQDRSLATCEVESHGGDLDRPALDGFIATAPEVDAAGVRVVHGGAGLRAPILVDDGVIAQINGLTDLAPLHNPASVAALQALRGQPELPVVACFDTGFHSTIPEAASTYAIPAEWRHRWGIRRFGFHGLSHAWAARRTAELLDHDLASLRLVTCHLGSGASLAAVRNGACVDTTMGFTPMEGLVMGTRSGSIDPGALLWVMGHGAMAARDAERALDAESGLLGLAGSADMRTVLAAEARGDAGSHLAVEVYLHRLRGLVAAMAVALGGLDALVFTGGVGEASGMIRQRCCAGLAVLGVPDALVDPAGSGEDAIVSPVGAAVAVSRVRAREDRQIAREVRTLLAG